MIKRNALRAREVPRDPKRIDLSFFFLLQAGAGLF